MFMRHKVSIYSDVLQASVSVNRPNSKGKDKGKRGFV